MSSTRRCHQPDAMDNRQFPHLPEEIIDHIVSYVDEARDIASCICVSRKWNHFSSFSQRTTVCFTENSCRYLKNRCIDVVSDTIRRMPRLQKLSLHTSLESWDVFSLVSLSPTLRHLKLRETVKSSDNLILHSYGPNQICNSLETLSLHCCSLYLHKLCHIFPLLTSLELVDVKLIPQDGQPVRMNNLEHCNIELHGRETSVLHLTAPKIKSLNLKGFSSITVGNTESLQSLMIDSKIDTFQFEGGFPALKYLSITGCPWCWDSLSEAIGSATNVKHLSLTYCNDIYNIQSQEIHIVDFFQRYPNLEKLHLNDNMLRALSGKMAPQHSYVLQNLKEVAVTFSPASIVRSFRNVEILRFLIDYGENLKSMQLLIPRAMDYPLFEIDMSSYYRKLMSSYPSIVRIRWLHMNITGNDYYNHRLCAPN